MPAMLQTQDLVKIQRELADKITHHAPLDDIRILLASGAQVVTLKYRFTSKTMRTVKF